MVAIENAHSLMSKLLEDYKELEERLQGTMRERDDLLQRVRGSNRRAERAEGKLDALRKGVSVMRHKVSADHREMMEKLLQGEEIG